MFGLFSMMAVVMGTFSFLIEAKRAAAVGTVVLLLLTVSKALKAVGHLSIGGLLLNWERLYR